MEPESSLPYPQVPASCPYPEPSASSPHNPLQLPEDLSQHIADRSLFLYIYHKSLIQSEVTFFFKSGPEDHFMYGLCIV
jgi:hypothetical protein